MPRFKYCTDQKREKKGSGSFWCMLWLQGLFSRKAFFSLMVCWDPGELLKTGCCSMNQTGRTHFFPKNWCLWMQFLAIKFSEISRISKRWHLNAKQEVRNSTDRLRSLVLFCQAKLRVPCCSSLGHTCSASVRPGSTHWLRFWFWELPLFKSSSPRVPFQKGWCLRLTKQSLVQRWFLLTAFCW